MSTRSLKRALSEEDGNDSSELAPPCKKSKFNGLDDDDDDDDVNSNNEIKTRLSMSGKPICLNVGGIKYETTLNTLSLDEESVLYKMFEGKFSLKPSDDGSYFIDRNGKYFHIILDYLRNRTLNIPNSNRSYIIKHLLNEAQFYQITPLIIELQIMSINSSILSTKQIQEIDEMINPEMIGKNHCEWKLLYKYNVSSSNPATKYHSLYHDVLSVVSGRPSLLIIIDHKGKTFGVYIKNKVQGEIIGYSKFERIEFRKNIENVNGFYFNLNAELVKTRLNYFSIGKDGLCASRVNEGNSYESFVNARIYPKGVEIFQL